MVGQVGLEPTTALSTGFTVRGDTNYTVLTHMAWMERFELPTNCFVGSYSIRLSYDHIWWNRPGLNQRRPDFQSGALPTELRFHISKGSNSTPLDFGVADGNRTRDRRNHNPLPYRLATPTMLVTPAGIEPAFPA